ncbi:mechanosensitive ion channel family protein [Cryobacterium roopkundense]|uniref:Small conductance mechanosensitive channel n=1 Tax=Cryobacterium roopkundense TaxID=1001240 RepID=A0A7W8ZWI7_9MICO|nr:mechanosensitive ion channel domain-containing protein [Cryobacterium roopkundense]MBB5641523.1 small conductance mechanosensitive channel [Cryobacterium roopkundense]
MNWDTFWAGVASFFATEPWASIWQKSIAIVGIILLALVLRWVLTRVIDRVVQQIVSGVKKNQKVDDTQALNVSPLAAVRVVQRSRTLGAVLTNIVNVFLLIVSMLLIVTTLNPDILGSFALLTAALGAGLGFGAQNIVKDILNGLFMVVEDQIGVGDIVDVGFASGVVETVGIRITQVRDVDGTLWFVRNGEILRVGNMSQGWARVIIDLAIPYSSDVEAVQTELLRVATALASSRKWRAFILEKPEIWGLESISAEALVTRLVVKTRVSAKWDFARDLRLHMKKALDGVGISLTPLNSVIMTGSDGAIDASIVPDANTVDAAEEAAAAVPDAVADVRTAPVPVKRGPRAPRKPKGTLAEKPVTQPVPKPPAKAPPRAPAKPLPTAHTAPDPQTRSQDSNDD